MNGIITKKKPLTCESKQVFIVIRKNKRIDMAKIKSYCQIHFEQYAFIEHFNDIQPNTGEVEGCHYHICGNMKRSKVAFSTRLNEIVDFFKFDNAIGIEIDQYRTFEGAIQYLTHKNFPEKTQHDKSEIVHDLSPEEFEIYYNAETGGVITFDLLYSVCLSSNNIIEVIKSIGVGNYRTWRSVICDIFYNLQSRFIEEKDIERVIDSEKKEGLL